MFKVFQGKAEIFKMGIYLLFPVASLFLFNTPGVLNYFPSPTMDRVRQDIDREKSGLYRIPTNLNEMDGLLKTIKQAKQKDDQLVNKETLGFAPQNNSYRVFVALAPSDRFLV